ncbi:MAG: hypothetical protein DRG78_18185 [Epsilonproteobacteria bacterium]|nr:MAG: hypothetical protein DRG78_18185 [Campylobacterota bacterium]
MNLNKDIEMTKNILIKAISSILLAMFLNGCAVTSQTMTVWDTAVTSDEVFTQDYKECGFEAMDKTGATSLLPSEKYIAVRNTCLLNKGYRIVPKTIIKWDTTVTSDKVFKQDTLKCEYEAEKSDLIGLATIDARLKKTKRLKTMCLKSKGYKVISNIPNPAYTKYLPKD